MPLLRLLRLLDTGVYKVERFLAIGLTAAIALIAMAQVVLRYFFHAPLFWAEEVAAQLLVFVTLLGLSLLIHTQQLISIDFLPRALPGRGRHILFAVLGLGMLALLLFIGYMGLEWVQRPDVRTEMSPTTQLPRWYNYAVLPVVFASMSYHQVVKIFEQIRLACGGQEA